MYNVGSLFTIEIPVTRSVNNGDRDATLLSSNFYFNLENKYHG
jgi:hypothetical protein